MLQATYKTSPYTFYLSTEDNRIDTSKTDTDNLLYSFKLTNDMSGEIQYAFGQNQAVYDRYTKLQLTHSLTPLYYSGEVNLVPNGYWNYELYEYSGNSTIGSACATVPNPATNFIGYYTITNPSGGVTTTNITAGTDIYEHSLTDLVVGNYYIKLYDNCDNLITSKGFTMPSITAQSDDTRWVEIENVEQTSTGITFDVVSNMPIGHSYDFGYQSGFVQVTDITSKPQTTSHSFTQVNPPASTDNLREMYAYTATGGNAGGGGSVFGGTTIDFAPVTQPSTYYGMGMDIAAIPVSVNGVGTVLSKGSAVITVIYGITAASTTPNNYYTLQGLITQGKLYVSEPSGEEQVQYLENSPASGNNYIWYGQ